jgi:uncharacterized protein (DUF1697 family)
MSGMPSHVAFLRAVNLGARRRAPQAELRAALEQAGFEGVQTFQASGNVVFEARADERAIVHQVERALADRLGFPVEVYLRSIDELRHLISQAERLGGEQTPAGALQVAFLKAAPGAGQRNEVLARATEHDLLAFAERELLWLRRRPADRSELNLRAIEQLIGPWTMRTLDTVSRIAARYFGGPAISGYPR